jgi:hypothetical protein
MKQNNVPAATQALKMRAMKCSFGHGYASNVINMGTEWILRVQAPAISENRKGELFLILQRDCGANWGENIEILELKSMQTSSLSTVKRLSETANEMQQ